jgi:hypothetical protein
MLFVVVYSGLLLFGLLMAFKASVYGYLESPGSLTAANEVGQQNSITHLFAYLFQGVFFQHPSTRQPYRDFKFAVIERAILPVA